MKATYQPHAANSFEADELLTCPCCGGKSELTFKGNNHTKSRSVTIKCTKCKLQRTDGAIRHDAEWCAKASIEQWNRRI